MAVTKRTRYEVLRRDNHQCRYCGATAPGVELTIDHVTPVSLGGSDAPSNLVAACRDCNAGKASSNPGAPLVATVSDDQLRWAEALKAAAEQMLADRDALHERTEEFLSEWGNYRCDGHPIPLAAGWRQSVDRWVALGLPIEVLCDDIAIAMGVKKVPPAGKFNYVAGIAWNQVRELQVKANNMAQEVGDTSAWLRCAFCASAVQSPESECRAWERPEGGCRTCGRPMSQDHSWCCAYENGHDEGFMQGSDHGRGYGWWEAGEGRDLVALVVDGVGRLEREVLVRVGLLPADQNPFSFPRYKIGPRR